MADKNSIPFDVVAQLKSRAISRDQSIQIKILRTKGLSRDEALLAICGKDEAAAAIIAKYPDVTFPAAAAA